MVRVILICFVAIVVSCYFFSFGFSFLPASINTKLILGGIGAVMLFGQMVRSKRVEIGWKLVVAAVLAIVFSLICFISTDLNRTDDFAYATYFVSFSIWLLAAYTVVLTIYAVHDYVNFRLLTYYLVAVCVSQCILALWIDSSVVFESFVNRYIEQGQEFAQEVDRLYGIGASLDNAGVRFSVVLLMLSTLFTRDFLAKANATIVILLLLSFFIILVFGSIISRTTSMGAGLALAYLLLSTGVFDRVFRLSFVRFIAILVGLTLIATLVAVYYYYNSPIFEGYMRFAFEGFFNFFENGEWRTDSTDKLGSDMWIWPEDTKTWIIGTGLFDGWIFNTDIGYCRFILYCGMIGFIVFALFFIYNALIFMRTYKRQWAIFFMLLVFSFTIWIKVSTDIFLVYALFYGIEGLQGNLFYSKNIKENENSLLYIGNL